MAALAAAGRLPVVSAWCAGVLVPAACWGAAWASGCKTSLRFAPSRRTATEMFVPAWNVWGAFTSIVWPMIDRRAVALSIIAITRAGTTVPFRGRLPSSCPWLSCGVDEVISSTVTLGTPTRPGPASCRPGCVSRYPAKKARSLSSPHFSQSAQEVPPHPVPLPAGARERPKRGLRVEEWPQPPPLPLGRGLG